MQKSSISLLIYILLIFCVVNVVAYAQKNFNNSNMTVILAIDGSGSMKKTDPEMLREQAAQLFTDFLIEGDQVAVLEFSSKVKIVEPLRTIQSYQDIRKIQESLSHLSYGGNTRLDLAIQDSINIFKDTNTTNKAIILLSDGALDVNGSPQSKESKEALNVFLNKTLPELKQNNIKVFSIGLINKKENKSRLKLQKDCLSEISHKTNGAYFEALNATELHKSFIKTIQKLMDPPQIYYVKENNSIKFFIDNKVNRLNIIIDKTKDPQSQISIDSPLKAYKMTAKDKLIWNKSNKYEFITILPPVEYGTWKITSNRDINKLDITIFSDSDIKIAPLSISGKREQFSPLKISTQVLSRKSNKEEFKALPLDPKNHIYCHITKPDKSISILPMILNKNNFYLSRYTANQSGIYTVYVFTEGTLMRRSQNISLQIKPEPPDEPKIIFDQSVYALGETIRATIDLTNKNIVLPEKFLIVDAPENNLSKMLKIKRLKSKIIATLPLKQNYKPGEYIFVLDFLTQQMKNQTKQAIAYVIGKISITTDKLAFGIVNSGKKASKTINIQSDLKLTTLPLKLELSSVKLTTTKIKPIDLLFYYPSTFNIQGESTSKNISLSLKPEAYQNNTTLIMNKTYHGTATFVLYSDQNEILDTKKIPISFIIPSLFFKNIVIIGFIVILIIGFLLFLYKKSKK